MWLLIQITSVVRRGRMRALQLYLSTSVPGGFFFPPLPPLEFFRHLVRALSLHFLLWTRNLHLETDRTGNIVRHSYTQSVGAGHSGEKGRGLPAVWVAFWEADKEKKENFLQCTDALYIYTIKEMKIRLMYITPTSFIRINIFIQGSSKVNIVKCKLYVSSCVFGPSVQLNLYLG